MTKGKRSLIVDMEVDDSLHVTVPTHAEHHTVVVTVLAKTGRRARIHVMADKDISVERKNRAPDAAHA